MNEESFRTSTADHADLTGTQFRYINAYSILLSGHKYLGQAGGPRPFIGVKTGTYYIDRRPDVRLRRIPDTSWHYARARERGLTAAVAGYVEPRSEATARRD